VAARALLAASCVAAESSVSIVAPTQSTTAESLVIRRAPTMLISTVGAGPAGDQDGDCSFTSDYAKDQFAPYNEKIRLNAGKLGARRIDRFAFFFDGVRLFFEAGRLGDKSVTHHSYGTQPTAPQTTRRMVARDHRRIE
jgi:hypothetical protein